ncbi:hypothetical protein GCM10027059_04500 [Myceligenerans halotolerans]
MSDTPSTAPRTGPEPDDQAGKPQHAEVPLQDVVDPGDVRRAPRYGRFLMAGAILGIAIGLGLGYYVIGTPEAQGMLKPGVYVAVTVAFTATFTTLVAGLLAVLADRRSVRRYERSRRRR